LLSHAERKNSWWLAELAGDVSPDGMQRLLNFSPWDEDAARDSQAAPLAGPRGATAVNAIMCAVDDLAGLDRLDRRLNAQRGKRRLLLLWLDAYPLGFLLSDQTADHETLL
jgi:hypothetical protein